MAGLGKNNRLFIPFISFFQQSGKRDSFGKHGVYVWPWNGSTAMLPLAVIVVIEPKKISMSACSSQLRTHSPHNNIHGLVLLFVDPPDLFICPLYPPMDIDHRLNQ